MDEEIQKQIERYRMTAESWGDATREAMLRGDIGLARTSARLAAQHARVAVQLETGERLIEPEDSVNGNGEAVNTDPPFHSSGETINV
jgi:hypothetical protein